MDRQGSDKSSLGRSPGKRAVSEARHVPVLERAVPGQAHWTVLVTRNKIRHDWIERTRCMKWHEPRACEVSFPLFHQGIFFFSINSGGGGGIQSGFYYPINEISIKKERYVVYNVFSKDPLLIPLRTIWEENIEVSVSSPKLWNYNESRRKLFCILTYSRKLNIHFG